MTAAGRGSATAPRAGGVGDRPTPRDRPATGDRPTPGAGSTTATPIDRAATQPLDHGAVLAFFAAHARDLPWRAQSAGPWAVLVSEVMLQQTPVNRVVPVYLEWLARWPTPADLAVAAAGDAVRVWGRLGYPRRALRLHAAAQSIVTEYAGRVPPTVEQLLRLPGVGEYTARAVAAFAYGARTPVIDTNVRRVLARAVRGVDDHKPATAADRAELEVLLPVDPRRSASFSAGLMELGALVCTASSPRCADCPLAGGCAWLRAGRPAGGARPPAQRWHGTDRQARGRLLAAVRDSADPVPHRRLDLSWPIAGQRERALDGLVADGLVVRTQDGSYALPGPT